LFLSFVLLASAGAAQTVKLNGPLSQPVAGEVKFFLVGATGSRVVYFADQETVQKNELYGAPLDGSAAAVKLNPPFSSALKIGYGPVLSADGSKVVFLLGTFSFATLHAVPTDGSAAAVALASIAIEDINNFQPALSPDGQWVVYRETGSSFDLSSVPADGSQPPIVLSSGAYVALFAISSDSARVVFLGAGGLFSVPIDGSAGPVQVNGPLVPGGGVDTHFLLSPDGARVVYRADQDTDEVFELYSAPIDGSAAPVKLNPPLVSGSVGVVYDGSVAISANSRRVVFLAEQSGQTELYGVPIDGGASVKLSGPLAPDRDVSRFVLTPDSRRALFLADRDADEEMELFMAPITGSAGPVQLNSPLVAGGDVLELAVAPDSEHAVYRADQREDGVVELFSVPLGKVRRADAPGALRLSGPLVAGGDVTSFRISLAGRRVVYFADAFVDDQARGFSVPIDGGPVVLLTPAPGPGGSVGSVTPAPGERGLFLARPDGNAGTSLFVRPLDGSVAPAELNGPLAPGWIVGEVAQVQATPDGSHAVYLADQELDYRFELFAVPSDGSAAPIKLNGPMTTGGSVGGKVVPPKPAGSFQIGPDGARVAYVANQDTYAFDELYCVPLDGSAPPVRLNDDFGAIGGVLPGMRFSADGSRVVYRAYLDGQAKMELFSVPADGSAAAVKLSGATPSADGDVEPDFTVSPTGSRVVYRSDQATDEKFELYSVPLDGSLPRTRLHGSFGPTRDVLSFRIDPTGQRVLFLGDLATENVNELYSVPILGTPGPTRLNTALPSGRDVADFRVSPDGTRAVYLADQLVNDRFELFSVPLDLSSAPVRLNSTPVTGGDVLSFELGPHGGRVVYLADQDVNDRDELFSVPMGGGGRVKLSGALVPGGDVKDFALVGRPARVVFLANARDSTTTELFVSPFDGGTPRRLVGSPLAGDTVESFVLDASGFQAVFQTHPQGSLVENRLFRVLLDGGRPAEPLTDGASPVSEYLLPPGQRVLHRTNREGAVELFSTRLPRVPRLADPLD
jgi:Tol biopolymer transport system component